MNQSIDTLSTQTFPYLNQNNQQNYFSSNHFSSEINIFEKKLKEQAYLINILSKNSSRLNYPKFYPESLNLHLKYQVNSFSSSEVESYKGTEVKGSSIYSSVND